MKNELSKTIATCAIWISIANVFIFGLFKMTGSTEFFVIVTAIIAFAAAGSTIAIWVPGNLGGGAEKEARPPSHRESGRSEDYDIKVK
jgi:hypothetical protein